DLTHSDLLRGHYQYVGRSLKVNGSFCRDTYNLIVQYSYRMEHICEGLGRNDEQMNTCLEGEPGKVAFNKHFFDISAMKSMRKPRTKQGVTLHKSN
ncbi:hypothetical protein, partial [Klebsiella pneumoniae]|uniref:hypothetical protein n=1 Tax=Klebsiella pneumoniae TaxID=573 RepID=UPI000E3CD776